MIAGPHPLRTQIALVLEERRSDAERNLFPAPVHAALDAEVVGCLPRRDAPPLCIVRIFNCACRGGGRYPVVQSIVDIGCRATVVHRCNVAFRIVGEAMGDPVSFLVTWENTYGMRCLLIAIKAIPKTTLSQIYTLDKTRSTSITPPLT